MTETLTPFEEIIIEKLVRFHGYNEDIARTIIFRYLPVIRLINDHHDSARIQAERYHEAHIKDFDPKIWIEKIHHLRKTHNDTVNIKNQITSDPKPTERDLIQMLKGMDPREVRNVLNMYSPSKKSRSSEGQVQIFSTKSSTIVAARHLVSKANLLPGRLPKKLTGRKFKSLEDFNRLFSNGIEHPLGPNDHVIINPPGPRRKVKK
jgi:hypothetical protein